MFTGIIKEIGIVKKVLRKGTFREFALSADLAGRLNPGDSISINGVCLTATSKKGKEFNVDVVPETIQKSTLGSLKVEDKVNLELPLAADQPLGGHLINGHTDCVGAVRSKARKGNSFIFEFVLPSDSRGILKYIVEKGPVAIDGISLTVVDVKPDSFTVSVIPFTLENTTLGSRQVGEKVNIEVDIIAKYVEKIIGSRKG